MPVSAEGLRRLAALNLSGEALATVLEVVAESLSSDDERRRKDRERKAALRGKSSGHSADSPQIIQGQSAEIPRTEPPTHAPLVRAFSIGEEEEDTPSLRSGDAFASEGAIGKYRDAKHELWGEGRRMLIELGVSKSQAGSLLGQWMRDSGNDAPGVLDVIRRAREFKPVEPIPWIVRGLPQPRAGPRLNGLSSAKPFKTNGFIQAAIESQEDADRERERQNLQSAER